MVCISYRGMIGNREFETRDLVEGTIISGC